MNMKLLLANSKNSNYDNTNNQHYNNNSNNIDKKPTSKSKSVPLAIINEPHLARSVATLGHGYIIARGERGHQAQVGLYVL